MYDFKNVFYFHATLTPQGLISDIGGKALWDSEIEVEKLRGQNFAEIIFWQHNENVSQNIANAIRLAAEGKPLELDTTFQNSHTQISTIRSKFTPIFTKNKKVEKIIFSSTDVTEYIKEVEFHKKRSERYLFAAESAEVGLWVWDLKSGELFTTPRCNEIYGLAPNEIMTIEKFSQTVHPEDVEKVQSSINESQQNLSDYNIEYRVISDSETIRWVSTRGRTFQEDGDAKVMMGSSRDITHRKLSAERLENLYQAEKEARDQVEEVIREKDHFLAVVSHELRSPLNSILGWSKILLTKEVDERTRKNALETIENSAKLQSKIISDLVDSAKIISGKLNFTFVTLSYKSLINRIYQAEKPLADERNINFVLETLPDCKVLADAARLYQAITNLVTNAIKFTPSGGEIRMRLVEKEDYAIFSITDSGSGIPPEELPFIFKQYFQSKTAKNKTGLGLGLSIVEAIVAKHKGQVSVKNNDNGVGCTFFISLPVQKSGVKTAAKNPLEIENRTNPLENITILIVEDNEDSREVLQFYLTQLGAKVYSADSSQAGLNYLTSAQSLPNLIISDISMPQEDGFTFIQKVRDLPIENGSSLPAIALTALATSGDTKRIMESGFQAHHAKPFDSELLVRDILEVLENDKK